VDWADTEVEAAFRREVRAFIDERLPELFKRRALAYDRDHYGGTYGWYKDRTSEDAEQHDAAVAWAEALAERGWAAPHWPAEYGGAGLTTLFQFIFKQEMAIAQAPVIGGTGVTVLGPTLILHGSDEQKRRYIPEILSGDARWVQGYSEPGAGSDLAALQTRAERDGDEYVINGQKIWTSSAAHRPGGAKASGDHVPARRRHRHARDLGATARRHGREPPPQRGVLRGCAHARRPRDRRGEPWLVRGDDAARLRALRHLRRGGAGGRFRRAASRAA
jgi:alkylation response protein AidB-like acyl-CoA dehydrogenase